MRATPRSVERLLAAAFPSTAFECTCRSVAGAVLAMSPAAVSEDPFALELRLRAWNLAPSHRWTRKRALAGFESV